MWKTLSRPRQRPEGGGLFCLPRGNFYEKIPGYLPQAAVYRPEPFCAVCRTHRPAPELGDGPGPDLYTEDSNIFAAAVCTLVAVCQLWCIFTGGELPRWLKRLKFMATSCLLLTFLTVVFVLAPMNGEGGLYMLLCTSSMLYHHLLNPMAALLSYLLLEREPHLPRSDVRWALLPTLAYAAVILPLNILRVIVGPYPFFEVYHQPVYVSVLWAVGLLGVNYLYAWLLWRLGGGRPRSAR